MSADNTIGILVTKRPEGHGAGWEYRVGYSQAIENVWFEPDYPSVDHAVLRREEVRRIFGNSIVHQSAEDALKEAFGIERDVGYVEYGIRVFFHGDLYFPASGRKRRRRRFAAPLASV